jgi:hypothetical protein
MWVVADRQRTIERARQIIALRLALRSVLEPEPRHRIEQVCRELADEIGPSIPKKHAAELLGVSVTTLDKWMRRNAIPARHRSGSSRAGADTETVLQLAEQRALADVPPTLAGAVEALAERRRSARQVEEAAELSHVLTSIAAAGGRG